MEWKKFFTPDWKKLVLFVVIIMVERVVSTFILGYYLVYGVKLSSILIVSPFDILNAMMVPILVTPDKTPLLQLCFDTFIGGLTQFLNLLWQYFLACLIVFAYDNFRKGKLKKKK